MAGSPSNLHGVLVLDAMDAALASLEPDERPHSIEILGHDGQGLALCVPLGQERLKVGHGDQVVLVEQEVLEEQIMVQTRGLAVEAARLHDLMEHRTLQATFEAVADVVRNRAIQGLLCLLNFLGLHGLFLLVGL
eukprot:746974-Pyramimonas_sp.AAC.1